MPEAAFRFQTERIIMTSIGAQVPYRRSRRNGSTGSLLLDRLREFNVQAMRDECQEMARWTGSRFRRG